MKCKSGSTACPTMPAQLSGSIPTASRCRRALFSVSITTRPRSSAKPLDFLEAAGVQNATFNILTPFPGTRLYQRLEAEGRILTRDWSKYNGRADVVFRPRLMSPEELLAGYEYANQRFYSWRSVCRRLARSPVGLFWTLPLNLAYLFAAFINPIAEAVRSGSQGEPCGRESAVSADPNFG